MGHYTLASVNNGISNWRVVICIFFNNIVLILVLLQKVNQDSKCNSLILFTNVSPNIVSKHTKYVWWMLIQNFGTYKSFKK